MSLKMFSLASSVILLAFLKLAMSQQIGREVREVHPKLNWTQCTADSSCREVGGELTLDEKWRWVHKVDSYRDCYYWGYSEWNEEACDSEANCTTTCAVEGADYSPKNGYGISAANNSVSLQLVTRKDFATNVGLRLFLLDSKTKYQTFTLSNNEFAFDVNLSSVGCGVNSALTFVEMEADGGIGRFSTNKAGAEYGVGYCDSKCTRDQLFVGGKVCPSSGSCYLLLMFCCRQMSKAGRLPKLSHIRELENTGHVAPNSPCGMIIPLSSNSSSP
jgi:cellulose 1,4-beta-cellobiosidase